MAKTWRQFDDHVKEQFLLFLSRSGQLVSSAAQAGVSSQTVRNHREADPEFDTLVEDAISRYRDSVDAEIKRRGIDGIEEPVFYQGVVVGWLRRYSDALALAHAKAHDPRYRERTQLDVKHSGGVMVVPAQPATTQDWTNRFAPSPS
jgi:hypothetical protein